MELVNTFLELNTNIHQWNPKGKFISLIVLIFVFSSITNLELLIPMMIICTILWIQSKLPIILLLKRWSIPSFFVIITGLFIMFFSGETVLFKIGFLSIKEEGLQYMILLVFRFLSIVVLITILFETTPFLTIIKVMESYKVPTIIIELIVFSYRYFYEILKILSSMQISMKLRGFKGKRYKDIVYIGSLIGTILVRSFERSEKVYSAMILRGYGQNDKLFRTEFTMNIKDYIYTTLMIIASFGLLMAQIYLDYKGA